MRRNLFGTSTQTQRPSYIKDDKHKLWQQKLHKTLKAAATPCRCCHDVVVTDVVTDAHSKKLQVVFHCCPRNSEFLSSSSGFTQGHTLHHVVPDRNVETVHSQRRSLEVFPPWTRSSPPLCDNRGEITKTHNSHSDWLKTVATVTHFNNRISNKQASYKRNVRSQGLGCKHEPRNKLCSVCEIRLFKRTADRISTTKPNTHQRSYPLERPVP